MFVVVVGSREWQGETATQQVNALLDELKDKYSGMVVISSSTDKGVGRIIRERCLRDKITFQFIDLWMRVFASLPKAKLAQVFFARNSALLDLGEEFHVFVDMNRRGTFEDLIERLETSEQKRPLYKHFPIAPVAPIVETPCLHERLDEEGICRACGADRRGI
jgi:hypothetical protein